MAVPRKGSSPLPGVPRCIYLLHSAIYDVQTSHSPPVSEKNLGIMSYNFTTLSCQDDSSTSCNGQAGLHYQPSGIGNAIFLAIFILCLLGQVYILIFKKLWGYTVFLGLAFFLEILGYVAKIQLRGNQQNSSAYIM